MQRHLVDLGAHKLHIYLPLSRTKMLANAQRKEEDLPYWAFFWPPAVGLGALLAAEPLLAGRTVVELGAGSAVVGLAAAISGAKVTVTDYLADSVALCAYNARKNNLQVGLLQADWKDLDIWPPGADVIVGSEVLYEPEAAEKICNLLASPALRLGGIFLIIDPGRPFISNFIKGLTSKGFDVDRAPMHFETPEGPQDATLIFGTKAPAEDGALLQSLRYLMYSMNFVHLCQKSCGSNEASGDALCAAP